MKKQYNYWLNNLGLLFTLYTSFSVMFYSIERLA